LGLRIIPWDRITVEFSVSPVQKNGFFFVDQIKRFLIALIPNFIDRVSILNHWMDFQTLQWTKNITLGFEYWKTKAYSQDHRILLYPGMKATGVTLQCVFPWTWRTLWDPKRFWLPKSPQPKKAKSLKKLDPWICFWMWSTFMGPLKFAPWIWTTVVREYGPKINCSPWHTSITTWFQSGSSRSELTSKAMSSDVWESWTKRL